MISKGQYLSGAASVLLLTTASAIQAQSTSDSSGEARVAEPMEEIIVTANRRSENMQDVPITISAFGGEKLNALNVVSTTDLPQLTPGLIITRTLIGSNAFLRGVGTTTSGYSTESPVATYIDGLYLPNSAAAAFSFNNIERIEVLKGPQGTLYGRNTTGGLINVVTREPGQDAHADVSASYGNYDTVKLNAYVSLPLSETLAANFAATYTNQADGWGRNIFLNEDAYKLRDTGFQTKVRWQPTSSTTITLRGFYDRIRTDQSNNSSVFPGSVGVDGTRYLGQFNSATRRTPFVRQRQYNISLKAEQDLGFAQLTSITGYINNRSLSNNIQNGIVGNPVAGQSAVNLDSPALARTFSQEVNLTSTDTGATIQWIAGLFYYDDNTRLGSDVYGTCVGTVCAAAPVPVRTTARAKTRSYAGYGQATYNFTPTTRLTLGLRYTRDEKTLGGLAQPMPGRPNSVAVLPATAVLHPGDPFTGNPSGIDTDVSYGKLTWSAVAAHDFTPDIHGYVSANRGFKSGGFNPVVFNNSPSRPEVLDAYEIGLKSDLFDQSLRLNVSAFYYDYKDVQLRTTAPPAPPGTSILFNAAAERIKGLDVDFIIAPVRGLRLNGGIEYLDAKFTRFPGGNCTSARPIAGAVLGGIAAVVCDLSGRRPASTPKWSYSLGISYTIESAIGSFELVANDGYKSSYYWEPDNRLKQDAYHLINASITWTAPQSRYSIQLFAKNLANTYYFASGSEGTGGNDVYTPAPPRTYGVTARYKF